ncbi:acylphosphatase [Hymenobacter sediminis]|uniref:acylphosphatase n=1 Tax=Hymenobacter sediminis TaxID=2218621 RepID=UPI000DA64A22|nr:acylphosphatase [Hymenobacter sediminis]RPD46987.1 acylphosphatase [Hymenobacter sediminis]
MQTEHRTILVQGHVQGVFYRQSTQQEARRLGLVGTVRNNPDGTVTVEAEGTPEALSALETWCRKGPPAARVKSVEVQSGSVQGYGEFEVVRGK